MRAPMAGSCTFSSTLPSSRPRWHHGASSLFMGPRLTKNALSPAQATPIPPGIRTALQKLEPVWEPQVPPKVPPPEVPPKAPPPRAAPAAAFSPPGNNADPADFTAWRSEIELRFKVKRWILPSQRSVAEFLDTLREDY